jgi:fatty acid amide hydrolase 2
MKPLHAHTVTELRKLIHTRQVSPVEVVEAHIRRIEAVNPSLNAVVATRFDAARREAKEAERQQLRSSAASLPPLLGIPCTIKEFYGVSGMPQTGGIWMRRNEIATEDAEVVRRVRQAGAIVLGVTNVPEGGLWMETHNQIYGRTSNPWDLSRTAGGSSGGEGAIIAAGGTPFGLGSDIGGSIRLPAAFCGIAGHKPTGRMVPNTGHWPPLEGELRAYLGCGPLARSVADLSLILPLLAGACPKTQDFVKDWPLGDPSSVDLRKLRVFPVEDSTMKAHPSMRDAVRTATRVLEAHGAHVQRLRSNVFRNALWIWAALMTEEGETSYAELVSGNQKLPVLRELGKLLFGRSRHTTPVLAVIAAQRVMKYIPRSRNAELVKAGRALGRELEDLLGDDGVILHPPYTQPAPRHGAPMLAPLDGGFTAIFNVLELPATVVPTGVDARGLPLSVQVVGKRGLDHLTLGVASVLEAELGILTPVQPFPAKRGVRVFSKDRSAPRTRESEPSELSIS